VRDAEPDRKKTDIRLEAAIAKLFCTEASWRIVDGAIQIRGGRGYETAGSLKARGEEGIPVERVMRDSRINTIIEGTSQIMRLFIAREALDPHARRILPLLNPPVDLIAKLKLVGELILFYVTWYPRQWFYWPTARIASEVPVKLRGHVRFIQRKSHHLARSLFHAMMFYQQGLEKKQRLLGRLVNIGTDLFAMAASLARAASMTQKNSSDESPVELADLFCREARRRIEKHFRGLLSNDDACAYQVARKALDGKYAWLEKGIISQD
jgi:hypothetical protein